MTFRFIINRLLELEAPVEVCLRDRILSISCEYTWSLMNVAVSNQEEFTKTQLCTVLVQGINTIFADQWPKFQASTKVYIMLAWKYSALWHAYLKIWTMRSLNYTRITKIRIHTLVCSVVKFLLVQNTQNHIVSRVQCVLCNTRILYTQLHQVKYVLFPIVYFYVLYGLLHKISPLLQYFVCTERIRYVYMYSVCMCVYVCMYVCMCVYKCMQSVIFR
jgi:hypothetical protein